MSICPADSGLFDKTVTVYRKEGEEILRQVIKNCYLSWEDCLQRGVSGCRKERKFLLIVPGNRRILPGDRVFDGIGPVITPEQWAGFIPVKVDALMEASYARAYSWGKTTSHMEAGR